MALWDSKTVRDVIQDIESDIYVLPAIQRKLVWKEEKMELLFDSLLKGNSFGGIMVIREERGDKPLFAFRYFSKSGEELPSQIGKVLYQSIYLVIDGQQRLQSFYMGLRGSINDKYLYFNLLSQKNDYEFKFVSSESDLPLKETSDSNEQVGKLWYFVKALFHDLNKTQNALSVADDIISMQKIDDETQKSCVRDNMKKFYQEIFVEKTIGLAIVQTNKAQKELEKQHIVELFKRLNNGGTRLSSLDLIASMYKGFDYHMEHFFNDVEEFEDIGISQDEVVKLLFLLQDNHAKEITQITEEDTIFAIKNRGKIIESLRGVRKFLEKAGLYNYYHKGGRSDIPLYFIAYHLFHKSVDEKTLVHFYDNYDTSNPDFVCAKRWISFSILNGVFSRGCGWIPYKTGIRKILQVMKSHKGKLFPVEELFSTYTTHPIQFNPSIGTERLPYWDRDFVLYLIYEGKDISGRDIDHIHARSRLETLYSSDQIHHIANYQLLDSGTNRNDKRAKLFTDWISTLGGNSAEYLKRHLIPDDHSLWEIVKFPEFITERAKLIIERVQNSIPSSLPGPVMSPPRELDTVTKFSKESLLQQIVASYTTHPILNDMGTWYDIYKASGTGPWAGRYRNELRKHEIITVADFALLIMVLQIKVAWDAGYAIVYRFHKDLPNGNRVNLNNREFGGWGWKIALEELQKRGFNWEEFLIK